MGIFGGAPSTPKPPAIPPSPPPPQPVADPLWYKSYQDQTKMKRGFSSTILTGGQGFTAYADNSNAPKTALGA